MQSQPQKNERAHQQMGDFDKILDDGKQKELTIQAAGRRKLQTRILARRTNTEKSCLAL